MDVRDNHHDPNGGSRGLIDPTSERHDEGELTVQISKETKPMMHLLRLLREMNCESGDEVGNNDPKGRAVTSLINDFEREVSSIEHRIKGQSFITNGVRSSLPTDWIALEDMHSGEIYYANEMTGDTQWERPCLEVGAGNISDKMTNYNSDINYVKGSHDSMNNINRTTNYQQDSHQQGNFEYTHQRSYDSDMFSSHHYNLESSSASRTINFDNNNTSCNQFVDNGSITSNNCNQDDERGRSISRGRQNNMNNADTILTHRNMILTENLPRGWLALEDPDSGETYFANEVTGELTWDRPKMQQTETNFDDDLPTGWIALEDADSGETYYLNEATMATTWDRPNEENGSEIDENNREHQSSEIVGVSCNNEDLPPGWEAILDPSSGDYYFAHESGETQWELPEFDQAEHDVAFDASGDHARSGGNDRFESPIHKSLLPGWFAAFDEDSGDHYYCNEETGETTWDIPSVAATPHDNPNDPVQASVAEEVEDDYHDIPPGWFSVKDPDSADIYFCNEETGETTWDHPASASRDANEQSISVYEDDSVSSSKY